MKDNYSEFSSINRQIITNIPKEQNIDDFKSDFQSDSSKNNFHFNKNNNYLLNQFGNNKNYFYQDLDNKDESFDDLDSGYSSFSQHSPVLHNKLNFNKKNIIHLTPRTIPNVQSPSDDINNSPYNQSLNIKNINNNIKPEKYQNYNNNNYITYSIPKK